MIDIFGGPKTGRPKKASYREGRTRQLNIRLSDEDLYHLEKLADFYGVTKTDYILMKIDEGLLEMRKLEKEMNT